MGDEARGGCRIGHTYWRDDLQFLYELDILQAQRDELSRFDFVSHCRRNNQ
jgi:hypothetical protein